MLLPHRELEWTTCKSPETVMRTLASMTEPTQKPWKDESTTRFFWGTVEPGSFLIGPYLYNFLFIRNYSVSIRIRGSVIPEAHGSRISLKMEINRFAQVFMPIWFAGLFFFFCVLLVIFLRSHAFDWPPLLLVTFMFVFGQALVRIPFKVQADRSEAVLREVFPS